MYFSLTIWIALAFFGLLFLLGIRKKEWPSIIINFLALASLGIAQFLESTQLSSREQITAIGIALIAVLVANSYLILRNEEKEYEEFEDTGITINHEKHDAVFNTSTLCFFNEMKELKLKVRVQKLLRRWNEGLFLVASGKLAEALHIFQRIDKQVLSQACRINIAAVSIETGHLEQAISALTGMPPDFDTAWQSHYNKGLAYYRSHEFREAVNCFEKISEETFENWRVPYFYARALRRTGNDASAARLFQIAIQLAPEKYQPYYYLALSLSKLGKTDEALVHYDQALSISSADATLWYNRGNILIKLQDYRQAIECYDRAIERNPGYILAWNNKGIALTRLGQIEEAIRCYRRALSYNSRYNESLLNCALALDSSGQPEKALEYYSRFLQNRKNALSEHLAIVKNRIASLASGWNANMQDREQTFANNGIT
ncbi:MAG: tetratricopeptide repeat protein [bacterium]